MPKRTLVEGPPVADKDGQLWKTFTIEGDPMPPAKPKLTIEVYKKVTSIRKKERWGVRIKASNNLTLFASEKYVNLSLIHI